jgi:hypothetical protein
VGTFRDAWGSLLSWVPPPVQAAIALVLALLIITKLAPRIIRGCGIALKAAWAPSLELLTYPEYLLTSAFRRNGRQPPPGAYAYGRLLGALAPPGTRLGQWLAARFPRKPRFPWKTTLLVIALLTASWYLAPKIPPGTPKTLVAHVNTDDSHVSTWLATGRWTPAATTTACTTAATHPRPRPQPPKKKSTRKLKKR